MARSAQCYLFSLEVGYYAALMKEENGLFQVQDATLGRDMWVSRRVLEEEASGYFLIPRGGELPSGWRAVTESEGGVVWGKGTTSGNDHTCTTSDDPKNRCPTESESGMAVQSVHLMLVSLNIQDQPVGYTPPVGPTVRLRVTYNQRDAGQPATSATPISARNGPSTGWPSFRITQAPRRRT